MGQAEHRRNKGHLIIFLERRNPRARACKHHHNSTDYVIATVRRNKLRENNLVWNYFPADIIATRKV